MNPGMGPDGFEKKEFYQHMKGQLIGVTDCYPMHSLRGMDKWTRHSSHTWRQEKISPHRGQ